MIPILFDKDETAFTSNGIGRLRDCISCIVTEERNGIYECDFEYPVTGANYDLIQCGRIVGVTHDDSGDLQPFDIVSYSRPIDGIVTFHCTHVSYRQSFLTVTASTAINSLSAAFTYLGTSKPANPFTYWTDKTSSGYLASADGTPRSVRQTLGGIEGSILDIYGGEYEWNKWTVKLWAARGQMRDFTIRYGVNMSNFTDETDYSEVYSSVIPYWTDGENTVVGTKVDAPYPTYTGRGECVPLDVSDKFKDKPTSAQVTSMAQSVIGSPYLPAQTITVEFVRLQDLGYYDYYPLFECKLCDTIKVIFPYYGMSSDFKIVKTEWNVLAGRYESMELGTLSLSLSEALGITPNAPETKSSGTPSFTDLNVSHDLTVGNDGSFGGSIWADGNIECNGALNNNGDISTQGDIYADGDITDGSGNVLSNKADKTSVNKIGTYKDSGEKSNTINSSTSWQVPSTPATVSLEKGTWMIIGFASFASNANKRRGIRIYQTNNTAGAVLDSNVLVAPNPDGLTNVQTTCIVQPTASTNTTFRVECIQYSGSSLTTTIRIQAVRLNA